MVYRIMVVDDSDILRIMLSEMLQALGHQIVGEAGSGVEALRIYKEAKPELVTLDVSMPDMDGLSLLGALRRLDPMVRAIMVTGNDQMAVEQKALALKALAVLRKPFSEDELSAVLARIAPSMPRKP